MSGLRTKEQAQEQAQALLNHAQDPEIESGESKRTGEPNAEKPPVIPTESELNGSGLFTRALFFLFAGGILTIGALLLSKIALPALPALFGLAGAFPYLAIAAFATLVLGGFFIAANWRDKDGFGDSSRVEPPKWFQLSYVKVGFLLLAAVLLMAGVFAVPFFSSGLTASLAQFILEIALTAIGAVTVMGVGVETYQASLQRKLNEQIRADKVTDRKNRDREEIFQKLIKDITNFRLEAVKAVVNPEGVEWNSSSKAQQSEVAHTAVSAIKKKMTADTVKGEKLSFADYLKIFGGTLAATLNSNFYNELKSHYDMLFAQRQPQESKLQKSSAPASPTPSVRNSRHHVTFAPENKLVVKNLLVEMMDKVSSDQTFVPHNDSQWSSLTKPQQSEVEDAVVEKLKETIYDRKNIQPENENYRDWQEWGFNSDPRYSALTPEKQRLVQEYDASVNSTSLSM